MTHQRWLLLFFGVLLAEAAVDTQIPKTQFSCKGRSSGYYADVDSGCQVYHMCDGLGRQFSYTCPNATLFQQRMLICDHWYMVNCSKSIDDYTANLRIGQREMPFVDDSESNPYHRTPRPDLLAHHSQSEYDIIYRTGKAYSGNNVNLVGAESDSKNNSLGTEPTYSLPSHWSTEYSQQHSTEPSLANFHKAEVTESPRHHEQVTTSESSRHHEQVLLTELPPINFKSLFKATTPQFPATGVTESPNDLLPPQVVSTELPPTNFKSLFKATTPVYPTSVNAISEEPSEVGVLPPLDSKPSSEEITEAQPSKYYQPPKFDTEKKMLDNEDWEKLRKQFLIPDYEFPLESVSRPSYDSLVSSFQVQPENIVIKVTKDA